MTGQAAPHPHQHPLQEGAGGPGGQGLGTGKCPLIVVLFSLVWAASPWGRWRWRRYNCARGEQGGGQERDIISLVCWWVGVGDNNVPLSSRELHYPVMSSSGDHWLPGSSDHELGHLGDDVGGNESDLPDLEDQDHDGDIPPAQARKIW